MFKTMIQWIRAHAAPQADRADITPRMRTVADTAAVTATVTSRVPVATQEPGRPPFDAWYRAMPVSLQRLLPTPAVALKLHETLERVQMPAGYDVLERFVMRVPAWSRLRQRYCALLLRQYVWAERYGRLSPRFDDIARWLGTHPQWPADRGARWETACELYEACSHAHQFARTGERSAARITH